MFSTAKTVFIVVVGLYNETIYIDAHSTLSGTRVSIVTAIGSAIFLLLPPFGPVISSATSKHVIASAAARKSHGATILCFPRTVATRLGFPKIRSLEILHYWVEELSFPILLF
jgi:hypothetical protein